MDKRKRMQDLINQLDEAAKSYYQLNEEIMSNFEYDALYDELVSLEEETGITLTASPSRKVGYELLSQLPKEEHGSPMLSLDKTKSREELVDWLGDHKGLLSYKLDGLTVILTYNNGELAKAVTRGNGTIGEVITNNARTFKNIPYRIPFKGQLILRGEAVIHYSDFLKINESLDPEEQYKNPRNLCSGSVRQLNNEITAKRRVHYYAFTLVSTDLEEAFDKKSQQLKWIESLGFDTVEYKEVKSGDLEEALDYFSGQLATNDVGSDGLVLTYDDISYSQSLGRTAKFPRDTIAFKWQDELKETSLSQVFWSASRTGLINPVAIFEPIELEGTVVGRASLHNISIIEKLELGIGDKISVYKANMIIPQIAENFTRSNNLQIPDHCPVCEEATKIQDVNEVKVLYCTNPECPAKKVKAFSHFVSRNAMNIEGLSEATLEKMIQMGLIHDFVDLYHLDTEDIKGKITEMEGFGEKSYTNMIEAVERSRNVRLPNLIFALGILHVGLSNAKLLEQYFGNLDGILKASQEVLVSIDGIGEKIAESIYDYFHNQAHLESFNKLLNELKVEVKTIDAAGSPIEGKTFVITGSLNHFENRDALKEKIESLGGKVTGSVSKKSDYLINNDATSNSSKNKKAKSLDIPIITEDDFLTLIN